MQRVVTSKSSLNLKKKTALQALSFCPSPLKGGEEQNGRALRKKSLNPNHNMSKPPPKIPAEAMA